MDTFYIRVWQNFRMSNDMFAGQTVRSAHTGGGFNTITVHNPDEAADCYSI